MRSGLSETGGQKTGTGYLLRFISSGGSCLVLISFIDNNENRDVMSGLNRISGHVSSILALCEGKGGIAEEISVHALEIEKILKDY